MPTDRAALRNALHHGFGRHPGNPAFGPLYNHPDRLKLAQSPVHPTAITPSTMK